MFGYSVHDFRIKLGTELAKNDNLEADIVIPVPDSGRMAAMGYSNESGIPLQEGLIRSHYTGRTFIEPSHRIRNFGVKIKFSPVKSVLAGKKVIVVDDSLVRGTTSRKIIQMIRKAGAKEVHFRLSSPPVMNPCYYGIDFPTKGELIASLYSEKEIASYIQADSIKYLPVQSLFKVIEDQKDRFCMACFTGEYPAEVPSNAEKERMEDLITLINT